MKPDALSLFVRESNWIEGIKRDPLEAEIEALRVFLSHSLRGDAEAGIALISQFVAAVQSDAVPRFAAGLNVRVGNHVPPPGGPDIRRALKRMFNQLRVHGAGPERAYSVHREYETLHPFTDGNGRSGRALWLHMMGGPDRVPLGFLHTWYYQSLGASR